MDPEYQASLEAIDNQIEVIISHSEMLPDSLVPSRVLRDCRRDHRSVERGLRTLYFFCSSSKDQDVQMLYWQAGGLYKELTGHSAGHGHDH